MNSKILVVNVCNGLISEALRHMMLAGIQIDILDNTLIGTGPELDQVLETHYLVKEGHSGMKVGFSFEISISSHLLNTTIA